MIDAHNEIEKAKAILYGYTAQGGKVDMAEEPEEELEAREECGAFFDNF